MVKSGYNLKTLIRVRQKEGKKVTTEMSVSQSP
jgi:hypothetical protein